MKNFKELRVWRESIVLVEVVYEVTAKFPKQELFGLTSQIRRAGISIPSNIAEGQGRLTTGEWLQFLGHARGSLFELTTQLLLANRLEYLVDSDWARIQSIADGVGKALSGLIEYVRRRTPPRKP